MTIQSLPPVAPPTPLPYYPVSPPPRRRSRGVWIGVAVVVGLIIGIAAVVGGGGSNKPKPATPAGLHVVAKTATSVTIAWRSGSGTMPTLYRIYRDNVRQSSQPGEDRRFADTGLTPLTAYRYQVTAYTDGQESERSAALSVTTPAATLASARFIGSYRIRMHVTNESGFTTISPGASRQVHWWFHRGASGRTVVHGTSWSGAPWTVRLSRHGLVYKGDTVTGISKCSFVTVRTAVAVHLRVVKAGLVDEVWTVKRFTGEMSMNTPAAAAGLYTCPSATFTASLVGRG